MGAFLLILFNIVPTLLTFLFPEILSSFLPPELLPPAPM